MVYESLEQAALALQKEILKEFSHDAGDNRIIVSCRPIIDKPSAFTYTMSLVIREDRVDDYVFRLQVIESLDLFRQRGCDDYLEINSESLTCLIDGVVVVGETNIIDYIHRHFSYFISLPNGRLLQSKGRTNYGEKYLGHIEYYKDLLDTGRLQFLPINRALLDKPTLEYLDTMLGNGQVGASLASASIDDTVLLKIDHPEIGFLYHDPSSRSHLWLNKDISGSLDNGFVRSLLMREFGYEEGEDGEDIRLFEELTDDEGIYGEEDWGDIDRDN